MQNKHVIPCIISSLLCSSPTVLAQVITDGSVGAGGVVAAGQGATFHITEQLGTRIGNNLFHSFQEFSLSEGEIALFSGDNALNAIINRVTGGTPSSIDGLIASDSVDTDIFLINPAGIFFGPKAQLDINGAFHASTAQVLEFSDGQRFDAVNTNNTQLSAGAPETFGFLGAPAGDIVIEGALLSAARGNSLSFSAANVFVLDSILAVRDGNLQISAVDNGLSLIDNSAIFADDTNTNQASATISLEASTQIIEDSAININAQDLFIFQSDVLAISNTNTNNGTAADININTTNSTIFSDSSILVENSSVEKGGNININSRAVGIVNTDLKTQANNNGAVGDISINGASGVLIIDTSLIGTTNPVANDGEGGDIAITSKVVFIENSDVFADTVGPGDAGHIRIETTDILEIIDSQVSSNTIVRPGSSIVPMTDETSATLAMSLSQFSDPNIGQTLAAIANGENQPLPSPPTGNFPLIWSAMRKSVVTNGGEESAQANIASVISPPMVEVDLGPAYTLNNAVLANGFGDAGSIELISHDALLIENSIIDSVSRSPGNANQVFIEAPLVDITRSKVLTTGFDGDAATIILRGDIIRITEDSVIDASNAGPFASGKPGAINIVSNDELMISQSAISISDEANSKSTDTGGIDLSAAGQLNINESTILVNHQGAGFAPNITIYGSEVAINGSNILLDDSQLTPSKTAQPARPTRLELSADSLDVSTTVITSRSTTHEAADNRIIVTANKIELDNSSIINSRNRPQALTSINNLFAPTQIGIVEPSAAISLSAQEISLKDNSQLTASGSGTADAGKIQIVSASLGLNNSDILTLGNNQALAGSSEIIGEKVVLENNSTIASLQQGFASHAGLVAINTDALSVIDSEITTTHNNGGQAGQIIINASADIHLSTENGLSFINNLSLNNTSGQPLVVNNDILPESVLAINAHQLMIEGQSIIGSSSLDKAGSVGVSGNRLFLLDDSAIISTSQGVDTQQLLNRLCAINNSKQSSSLLVNTQEGLKPTLSNHLSYTRYNGNQSSLKDSTTAINLILTDLNPVEFIGFGKSYTCSDPVI